MAGGRSVINAGIWNDHDFRSLPAPAQHLYLLLWTDPALTYVGVADYRPGRIATRAQGLTADIVEALTACLEARHFVVVDRDSEEVLIRSWMRWDGLMKQPRLPVSMAKAYANTASNRIRGVIVSELNRIRSEAPELPCWSNQQVADVLSQPSLDAKTEPIIADPFDHGFDISYGKGFDTGFDETQSKVSTPVSTPSTPALTPTPYSKDSSSEIADAIPDRDDVLELCNLLADLMVDNGNKRPTITKAWMTDARLLLDKDERDLEEAKHLIRWCQGDSFWRSNIMSMSKFRQQYDKLRLRREPAKPEPREEFDWQNRGWGR